MTEIRGRAREVVRGQLRLIDKTRAVYADAVFTRIGQAAMKMFIAAAVLLVVLMASIAIVWLS
ncbi:hypothetical protein [Amycolatopsis sp. NPDC021455]|uniref:hypothetical protein n=1 Tax=Amycolatopsis sp. NPDC021455 TaxID=3154901 RepID=UPI0033D85B93